MRTAARRRHRSSLCRACSSTLYESPVDEKVVPAGVPRTSVGSQGRQHVSMDENLEALLRRILEFNESRAWAQFHSAKNLTMALAGEVGELVALFQWADEAASDQVMTDPRRAAQVRDELADVLIYLLTLSHRLDVDLVQAALVKLDSNESRYPTGLAAGRSDKYTELRSE